MFNWINYWERLKKHRDKDRQGMCCVPISDLRQLFLAIDWLEFVSNSIQFAIWENGYWKSLEWRFFWQSSDTHNWHWVWHKGCIWFQFRFGLAIFWNLQFTLFFLWGMDVASYWRVASLAMFRCCHNWSQSWIEKEM